VAGAAQAQSSVTIYGILDAGYTAKDATSLKYTASSNSISQVKTDTNGVTGVGSESTSRLGFRGTEDLGGGLKANFVFETQLNPAESTITAWNNRQAFVGLSGGFGSLNVGTVYRPHHLISAGFSASTLPNVVGDVMYVIGGTNTTLDKVGITGANGALINVSGGNDMTLDEARKVVETVSQKLDEDARIIWGAQISEDLEGVIRTILIVTGVKSSQILGGLEPLEELRHREIEEELGIEFVD
jgi:predicted porin